jgi:hypothetical protein
MSDLRVALVAEGPIDAIVIEAALKALLPRPFVLTQLQPESTRPRLGGGWGGVARWCDEFAGRGHVRFEDDPTLPGFDLFVVHVDADVAEMSYADYGPESVARSVARGWPTLPRNLPCPPPTGSADAMRTCLLSWAGLQAVGLKTVFCVPSKAPEAWLVAALFNQGHPLLNNLECNSNLEEQLKALPKAQRVKKTTREYRSREKQITMAWSTVRQRCSQAERFSTEVSTVAL